VYFAVLSQETRHRQLDDALTLLERDTAALTVQRTALDERTQTLLDGEARLAADAERSALLRASLDRERSALQQQQSEHRQTAHEAHSRRVESEAALNQRLADVARAEHEMARAKDEMTMAASRAQFQVYLVLRRLCSG
jgi:hypothetical protein